MTDILLRGVAFWPRQDSPPRIQPLQAWDRVEPLCQAPERVQREQILAQLLWDSHPGCFMGIL